jgi:hypothetical protein
MSWETVLVSDGVRCDNANCRTQWGGQVARVWLEMRYSVTGAPYALMLCEHCKASMDADVPAADVTVAIVDDSVLERREARRRRSRERAATRG